jgi:4-hydroxy-4-methyl-2-oxoglutarate aldolase
VNQTTSTTFVAAIADWKHVVDRLGVALVLDVMDGKGLRQQALKPGIIPRTSAGVTLGRAKTFLWMDFAHDDPNTYELELKGVDSVQDDDFIVCATGNSHRSGIWGELLTTAAVKRNAAGIVTDGGVRDVAQIEALQFPVYSRYLSPYDSFNRQKVTEYDVAVEIDGVSIQPGDIVVADRDGVAIVPARIADEVLKDVLAKAGREDQFRDAVKNGSSLFNAYQKYHVL